MDLRALQGRLGCEWAEARVKHWRHTQHNANLGNGKGWSGADAPGPPLVLEAKSKMGWDEWLFGQIAPGQGTGAVSLRALRILIRR